MGLPPSSSTFQIIVKKVFPILCIFILGADGGTNLTAQIYKVSIKMSNIYNPNLKILIIIQTLLCRYADMNYSHAFSCFTVKRQNVEVKIYFYLVILKYVSLHQTKWDEGNIYVLHSK